MNSKNSILAERANSALVGNYARYPATMVKGNGCRLYDADGNEYLDFLSGIAVCALGHCHPDVTEAIRRQAGELVHVSNLYYTEPQTELAELLVSHSFAEKVFFCNSGAEANEAAIKLARIASTPEKYEIISLAGSFHGRTLATVAATGQPKFHKGFEPLPSGFQHVEFGDLSAIEKIIGPSTCAVLCEPLQGEGGVRPLDREYLHGIRELCTKHGILLIFDEIQTGIGRTGSLFAYEQTGVTPDIMTLAKGLANGLPIGAMLTSKELAAAFVPGTHASTFGGNPVACAAAVATLRIILEDGFLCGVKDRSKYFRAQLEQLVGKYPELLLSVRGQGMLLGLVLTEKACQMGADMVFKMFEKGYLLNFAGGVALRFVPPLIVNVQEIDQLVVALDDLFSTCGK